MQAARTERARRRLYEFVRQAWAVVEPRTPLAENWHLEAICEHLEACSRGELRRLIVNVPPRCTKSLLVAVFWPAWTWATWPEKRWLFASYCGALATRDSVRCRQLITSPWYQERFGDTVRLTAVQNEKNRFENDRSGARLATSPGGVGTGEGGDFIVADDPHNVAEIESDAEREAVLAWWSQSMSTRGNDPARSAHVVVMQRLHERDLAGALLAEGGYEHLCLPMEFDPARRSATRIGWRDPRREAGELLWPARFDRAAVEELKRRLRGYGASGQLQQLPAPPEGGLFPRASFRWFRTVRDSESEAPAAGGGGREALADAWFEFEAEAGGLRRVRAEDCWWFQTLDTAQKTGPEHDFTVLATVAVTPEGELLVYDVERARLELPEQLALAERQWARFPWLEFQAIEDRGSGTGLLQEGRRRGRAVLPLAATADKRRRAAPLAAAYALSRVHHRAGAAWLAELEAELLAFPHGAHDDQVDALAYAAQLVGERSGTAADLAARDVVLWPA